MNILRCLQQYPDDMKCTISQLILLWFSDLHLSPKEEQSFTSMLVKIKFFSLKFIDRCILSMCLRLRTSAVSGNLNDHDLSSHCVSAIRKNIVSSNLNVL